MFYQPSLLSSAESVAWSTAPEPERIELGRGAWLDWCSDWLAGSDDWFGRLSEDLPWRSAERPMYDRIVAVPRLVCSPGLEELPASLAEDVEGIVHQLSARYRRPLRRFGANWYRSGADSVAPHPDKVDRPGDAIVAIVAVGERRPFIIRPLSTAGSHGSAAEADRAGAARTFDFGRGDLLVMGGTCQAFFEHGVPKTARPHSQRISMMFRG